MSAAETSMSSMSPTTTSARRSCCGVRKSMSDCESASRREYYLAVAQKVDRHLEIRGEPAKVTRRSSRGLLFSREEEVDNHCASRSVSRASIEMQKGQSPSVIPTVKVTALAPSPPVSELSLPVLLKLLAPKYLLPIILGFSLLSLSDSSLALAPAKVRSLHWAMSSAKSCRPSRVGLSSDDRRRGRRHSIEVVVLVDSGERSESREEERSAAGIWRTTMVGGVEWTVSASEGSSGRADMARKAVARVAVEKRGGKAVSTIQAPAET